MVFEASRRRFTSLKGVLGLGEIPYRMLRSVNHRDGARLLGLGLELVKKVDFASLCLTTWGSARSVFSQYTTGQFSFLMP